MHDVRVCSAEGIYGWIAEGVDAGTKSVPGGWSRPPSPSPPMSHARTASNGMATNNRRSRVRVSIRAGSVMHPPN